MIHIIGAGLAGSEAAWQLASRGHSVRITEMRPQWTTPAHKTDQAAEMVCSNSFKSDDPNSATGILKAEMRRMDSLILRCAEATRVPAGNSLAVDRELFSSTVTETLKHHPNIEWVEAQVSVPDLRHPTILATGPLTSDPLVDWLAKITGSGCLHFYDAIAPIVELDSIDMEIAWKASRYDKGGADFINCLSISRSTRPSWTPCSRPSGFPCMQLIRLTSRPACPSRSWRIAGGRPFVTAP